MTLLLAGLTGCASTGKKPAHPDDPLLLSKKPVNGMPEPQRPMLLARAEPIVPTIPHTLLAERPSREPISVPSPPVAEVTTRAPVIVRAIPASRRRVSGTYGHAEDFRWLQGTFTRTAAGTLQLRYLAPSPETAHEGVATLEDNPRLSAFRTGDVILVEGEEPEQPTARPYRVRSVWLVQRGE